MNQLSPEDFETLAQLARGYMATEEYERAFATMKLVCERRGKAEDWRLLAACAQKCDDEDVAVLAYEKCLAVFGDDLHVLVNLGELYLQALRYTAASKLFKRVLELDPQVKHPAGVRARMLIAKTAAKLA